MQEVTTRLPGRMDTGRPASPRRRPDARAECRSRPRRARKRTGGEYDEKLAGLVRGLPGRRADRLPAAVISTTHTSRTNPQVNQPNKIDQLSQRSKAMSTIHVKQTTTRRPSSTSPDSPTSVPAAPSCSATAPTSTCRCTTWPTTRAGPTSPRAAVALGNACYYDWSDPEPRGPRDHRLQRVGRRLGPHLHLHPEPRRDDGHRRW